MAFASLSASSSSLLSPATSLVPCTVPSSSSRGLISIWIRMMGGGPRTFPGGVTKWQWKRMQEKKARHLEKARLQRERQIYEMRRRAELLAAAPELEKPWEKHSRFRPVSRVTADEQIKILASRFEKSGGEDLWNDADGPVTFVRPDGQPSARLFPPNAIHSTEIYEKVNSFELANLREGQKNKVVGSSGHDRKREFTEIKESTYENFPSSHLKRNVLVRKIEETSFKLDFSGRRRPRNANFKQ